MSADYIIIPGTQQKVFENSVVMLARLPGTKWIIHCGFYEYNGRRQKGWYFSSIPSGTVMPVFTEDLVAMTVLDEDMPCPPCPPGPPGPGPGPGPYPPAPTPTIFTPEDKEMISRSMITVESLEDRDKLSSAALINGRIVRVNDSSGRVEYYEWNSSTSAWVPATLGYRYMTRDEITSEIDDSIVDVTYSDSNGALVVTAYSGDSTNIQLTGLAHNPIYNSETLTLRIPVFGHPDAVITIPKDKYIKDARFDANHALPDGTYGAAIIFTVTDGEHDSEIVMDARGMYNIYKGSESEAIKVYIDSPTNSIVADIKLSSITNNALKIDNEGLFVDITGKVDKQQIEKGYLLVADGLGGFTYADPGIKVVTSGVPDEVLTSSNVVTGNLIKDAIVAAIAASESTIQPQIDALDTRVSALESKMVGQGNPGEVVLTTADGLSRSSMYIGTNTLSSASNTLATESAVKDALSWKVINS